MIPTQTVTAFRTRLRCLSLAPIRLTSTRTKTAWDDYTELFVDGTLPTGFGPDADSDGLPDASEALEGTNPNLPDSDGDGLLDGTEVFSGLDPTDRDTDNDGCEDAEDFFPNTFTEGQLDCEVCSTATQCDDGLFCNGAERCEDQVCVSGVSPCENEADLQRGQR